MHMHVAGVSVFAPREDGPLTYEDVAEVATARLHLAPRLRQRVLDLPGGLTRPLWVDDDHFDLDFHLRRAAIPAPGRRLQLERAVGRVLSRPLDRSEAALGALRLRGAGGQPNGGPVEDAPRAGGRDLGDADRVGVVRPLARRRYRRAAEGALGAGAGADRARARRRRRPRPGVAPDGGARAGGGGADARRGRHRRDARRTPIHRRDGSAAARSVRRARRAQSPVRDRRGAVRAPSRRQAHAGRNDQRRGARGRRRGASRSAGCTRRADARPDAPRDGPGLRPVEGRAG